MSTPKFELRDKVYALIMSPDYAGTGGDELVAASFREGELDRHQHRYPMSRLVVDELEMPSLVRSALAKGAHFGPTAADDCEEVGCWFGDEPWRKFLAEDDHYLSYPVWCWPKEVEMYLAACRAASGFPCRSDYEICIED